MTRILTVLFVVLLLATASLTFAQDGTGEVTETPTPVDTQGLARVEQALAHVSGYLGLETAITLAGMDANLEEIPYTSYTFDPVIYTSSSMGCPEGGRTYVDRSVSAYRILITVRGVGTFDYRATPDGSVLIMCVGGDPHVSSIGLQATYDGTVGEDATTTTTAAEAGTVGVGLVGGPARVDQALRHLSAYLDLDVPITLAKVTGNDPFILFTEWGWEPLYYLYAGDTQCPYVVESYDPGMKFGYRVTLNVDGDEYIYYTDDVGSMLLLCDNNAVDPSSIIPADAATQGGLVG